MSSNDDVPQSRAARRGRAALTSVLQASNESPSQAQVVSGPVVAAQQARWQLVPMPLTPQSAVELALDLTRSKYGGQPYLPASERWPTCSLCQQPMQHLLQLNLQQLPDLAQQALRLRRGLLQVFVCVTLPCCQPHHTHKLRQDIQVQVVSMKPPGSTRVLDAQPVRDVSRAPTTQLLAATGLPIGEVPRLISVRELVSSSHADPIARPSLLTTSSPAQSGSPNVDADLDQIGSLRSELEVPSSSSRSALQSQPVDSMEQPLRRVIGRFSYQVMSLQPTAQLPQRPKAQLDILQSESNPYELYAR
jgi:hypothetical protein